jgi:hypothetical protein
MPSPLRRIAVILAYVLLTLAVYLGIEQMIVQSGSVSTGCVDNDVCTPVENVITIALGGGFLVTSVACAILGWRAKLFGARKA